MVRNSNTINSEYTVSGASTVIATNKAVTMTYAEQKAMALGLNVAHVKMGNSFVEAGKRGDFLRQRATYLKRDVSALRNDLLLLAFTLGGVGKTFFDTVDAAVKFQVALAGVRSVALATGNDISNINQSVLVLTKDGLLSMAGAAQGLKNLLATGLNLEQATNLMKVFKDAAAFNRQGILEFEEAIVRATAGVKMQNIRLIDDVGIRTRIGQMMKKQGYELQDLTDDTKKAGAIQALYNGLMKEGNFFLGDAARLTATFAGTQSQIQTQLFKTKAAFGDILISNIGGIFASAGKEVLNFLEIQEMVIKANKEMISVKIKEYFIEFKDILSGIINMVSTILSPIKTLIDVVSGLGITKWIIWFALLGKIGSRLFDIQKAIINFAGAGFTTAGLAQTRVLSQFGTNLEKVATIVGNTKAKLTELSESFKFPKDWSAKLEEASFVVSSRTSEGIARMGISKSGKDTGANLRNYWAQKLRTSEEIVMAEEYINQYKKAVNSLNATNFTEVQTKLKNLGAHLNIAGIEGANAFNTIVMDMTKAGNQIKGFSVRTSSVWSMIKTGAEKASIAISGFFSNIGKAFMANLPLLAVQAIIMAIVYAIDKLQEKSRQAKELQQKLIQQEEEVRKIQKDAFDSRLSELGKINQSLEEYNTLNNKVNKDTSDISRMTSLEKEILDLAKKNNIELDKSIANNISRAKAVDLVIAAHKRELQQLLENRRVELEYSKEKVYKGFGETVTETSFLGIPSKYTILQELIDKAHEYGQTLDMTKIKELAFTRTGFYSGKTADGKTIVRPIVIGLKASKDEVGLAFMDLINEVQQRRDDTWKAYTEAARVSKDSTGKTIITEQVKTLKLGLDSLDNWLIALRQAGLQVTSFDKDLASLVLQLKAVNEQTDKGSKNKQFEAFLLDLKKKAEQLQSKGRLQDKLIEARYLPAELATRLKEMSDISETDRADATKWIGVIEKFGAIKVFEEAGFDLEKMNEQLDLQIEKLGKSDYQMKLIDVDRKRINDTVKLKEAKENLIDFIAKNPTMNLKIYKDFLAVIDGILNRTKLLSNAQRDEITIEEKLKNTREYNLLKQDLDKIQTDYILQVKLLGATVDEQALYNAQADRTTKILELNNKKRDLELEQGKLIEIAWVNSGNQAEMIAKLDKNQIEQIDMKLQGISKQIIVEQILSDIKEKQLNQQRLFNKLLKEQELTKLRSETGFAGAAYRGAEGLLGLSGGGIQGLVDQSKAIKNAQLQRRLFKAQQENLGNSFEDIQKSDKYKELTQNIESENLKLAKSFEIMADSIANSINSLLQNLDIFGNQYIEQMSTLAETHKTQLATIAINERVNQELLMDSYQRGLITFQEYEIEKMLSRRKSAADEKRTNALAVIEQQKANELRALDQKIAVATFLQTKALEFTTLAAAYAAGGAILTAIPGLNIEGWSMLKAAAAYGTMAGLLGAASSAYGGPANLIRQKTGIEGKYNTQKAGIEGTYNKEVGIAENIANQQRNALNPSASATGGTLSGNVQAQELHITISPIVTIRGETVIMSNIGVAEAAGILGEFTVKRIQEAIENKEITLGN